MNAYAAELEAVTKRYGDTAALDGLNLAVEEGAVHGLLGPNGAGKTTAVRVLSTLLRFDAGSARVGGLDVVRDAERVRDRIALTGQYAAVDEPLSGRQNLVMFGRLFGLPARAARQRADELLEQFSLTDAATKSVSQYSGGMRRRLDLAASVIRTPYVLFLDEPTTGLDPHSRNELWSTVRSLVTDGTTVLLTTQNMEEADQLASWITVVDRGMSIIEGSPDDIKHRTGGDRIEVVVRDARDLPVAAAVVARVCPGEPTIDPARRSVSAPVSDRIEALTAAMVAFRDEGVPVEDVGVRRPTLDEAFLELTGLHTEEVESR